MKGGLGILWGLFESDFERRPRPMSSESIDQRIGKLAESLHEAHGVPELTSGLVRRAVKIVVEQLLEAKPAEWVFLSIGCAFICWNILNNGFC